MFVALPACPSLADSGSAWPENWASANGETFLDWWNRNRSCLPPLDPRVYEQCVFRHWDESEYLGFSLDLVKSNEELFDTDALLSIDAGGNLLENRSPERAKEHYEHMRDLQLEPVLTMNRTGTWDYPILVARSPGGFYYDGMRYLLALVSVSGCASRQAALVLGRR